MSTKTTTTNYLSFFIATSITVAAGYGLSLAANALYLAKFTKVQLPLGDTSLILGGMYFAVVALVGVLIAYFYERFRLS